MPILLRIVRKFKSRFREGKSEDCWEWFGEVNNRGYGVLTIRRNGVKRRLIAHRISFSVFKGAIPAGFVVMHKCDNRLCVNPDHLNVGTQLENEADKVAKGRSSYGDRRWSAQLTNDQAQEILNRCRAGEPPIALADEYKVSVGIVYSIKSRRRWKHLD